MIAPALTQVGIPPVAAHMFIFYYAVLSDVSPPTALAPYAAAAITGGDAMRTTLLTWKYTLPAFIVPFAFTLAPEGMGLLLRAPDRGRAPRVALGRARRRRPRRRASADGCAAPRLPPSAPPPASPDCCSSIRAPPPTPPGWCSSCSSPPCTWPACAPPERNACSRRALRKNSRAALAFGHRASTGRVQSADAHHVEIVAALTRPGRSLPGRQRRRALKWALCQLVAFFSLYVEILLPPAGIRRICSEATPGAVVARAFAR